MPNSAGQQCKRVVVTGGAGFIGGAVCRRLLDEDYQVVAYDSLAGGARVEENAAQLQAAGAQMVRGDVRDASMLRSVLQGCDGVVHLAAIASVPVCIENPELCRSVNLEGTLTLLAAAEAAGVPRMVFASTAAIYGPEPRLPSREDDIPVPASPYADSKLKGELAMSAAGIETVLLRFFNVYGPGQDPQSSYSGVISRWADALQRQESLTLFGDGSQTRDFIHVDDVAAAIHAALTVADRFNGPINIGSGQQTSLNKLVEVLAGVLQVQPQIRYAPSRTGDVPHSCAEISRARQWLGFSPAIELQQGLQSLIGSGK